MPTFGVQVIHQLLKPLHLCGRPVAVLFAYRVTNCDLDLDALDIGHVIVQLNQLFPIRMR